MPSIILEIVDDNGINRKADTHKVRVDSRAFNIIDHCNGHSLKTRDQQLADLRVSQDRGDLMQIVAGMMNTLLQADDTINGYTKKQWKEMHDDFKRPSDDARPRREG